MCDLAELYCVSFYDYIWPGLLEPVDSLLEKPVQVLCVVADDDETDLGRTPYLMVIELGDGNVELARQAMKDRLDDAALFFERRDSEELEFEYTRGHQHEAIVLTRLVLAN